jgi:hypothetical protein
MPIYLFQNPKTKEIVEVFQTMKENHVFFNKEGLEYSRVFTVPNASIDTSINPFSSKDFVEKTANKSGTIGDLLDKSKELSEKRGGQVNDPVMKNYFSNYQKEKGIKHASEIKIEKQKKAKEKLKKFGVSLSD